MESITNIAQALSVIAACWAIVSGVDAWKREFIGKRRIELAEDTMSAFFEIKDAIASIRNPFSTNEEGKSRKKAGYESEVDSELLDRGYVVFERYEAKKEIFSHFNTLKYRFMASFGHETEEIFKETNRCLNNIFSSARMLTTHYWKRQGRVKMEKDEFEKHLVEMHKHEGIFWDMHSEEDEVRKQLEEIQAKLDRVIKPYFEESMKSYSLFTKPFKKWSNKAG